MLTAPTQFAKESDNKKDDLSNIPQKVSEEKIPLLGLEEKRAKLRSTEEKKHKHILNSSITKQSNSNINLPVVHIVELPEKISDNKIINSVEGFTNSEFKEEAFIKTEDDIKSKSVFNNKSRTKSSIKNHTQMSSTAYNFRNSNLFAMSVELQRNGFKDVRYKYIKPKDTLNIYKSSQINNIFSHEKLEPDFNFKTTQINFDPLKGLKNTNKIIIAQALK